MSNDEKFPTYAQMWERSHGRKPTPEELEDSRSRALMVLGTMALQVSDSERIWNDFDKKEDHD